MKPPARRAPAPPEQCAPGRRTAKPRSR